MNIPAVSHSAQITTQQVTPATLKRANDDGDGKTGTAALNDGDAAATAAAAQVKASTGSTGSTVNIKA